MYGPGRAAGPGSAACTTQATYTDPFAYCSAVGTIDAPDSRYTGVPVPDAIIQGYLKAAGLENNGEPMELLQKSTIWRCMNKSVYVCNFGANLPCDSKADTNKNPTQAMQDFCKANPNAGAIPMSVTGHATIYSWGCVKDTPKLLARSTRWMRPVTSPRSGINCRPIRKISLRHVVGGNNMALNS